MTRTHVVIIDGTLSRLKAGQETNAGILYKLLAEMLPNTELKLYYDPGVQGTGLSKWIKVAAGVGTNISIANCYRQLSNLYYPGDRIMLFGFSRGAYAVRSLAGMIARVGLLQHQNVTDRRAARAFRHYESASVTPASKAFSRAYCHTDVKIEFVGVWDTVKALGIQYPLLWRIAPMATEFHDHRLSNTIANAFQALAIDETRKAYTPILWEETDRFSGHVEQKWFPGAHGDIGGHIIGEEDARPLSNIPLVWMIEKAAACGLPLPTDWAKKFDLNPAAPMAGSYSGAGKFFFRRSPRTACATPTETLHHSVKDRMNAVDDYRPRATIENDHLIAHPAIAE